MPDEGAFRQRRSRMDRDYRLLRYRRWYARLLRLYPKPFRERFGESMEQTFCDVCRAHGSTGRGLFGLALWLGVETVGGIMNEHMPLVIVRRKSIVRAALVTVGVLLIPLWGVFYVDGWNWDWHGFVVAGALVFTAAMTYEVVARTMRNRAYRFAVGLAVMTAFVLTWVNGSSPWTSAVPMSCISVWSSSASLGPPSRGCGRAEWCSHWSGWPLLKCSCRSSRLSSGRPLSLQEPPSPA